MMSKKASNRKRKSSSKRRHTPSLTKEEKKILKKKQENVLKMRNAPAPPTYQDLGILLDKWVEGNYEEKILDLRTSVFVFIRLVDPMLRMITGFRSMATNISSSSSNKANFLKVVKDDVLYRWHDEVRFRTDEPPTDKYETADINRVRQLFAEYLRAVGNDILFRWLPLCFSRDPFLRVVGHTLHLLMIAIERPEALNLHFNKSRKDVLWKIKEYQEEQESG